MRDRGPLAGGQVVEVRPATTEARAVVERALGLTWASRAELVGVQGARIGSGRTDGEFWQAGGWFLKSRAARRWPAPAAALAALTELDQRRGALGALIPVRSALAVIVAPDGVHQLWTLAPLLITLRERLDAAAAGERWPEFGHALVGFAMALGEALTASLELGLGLDVNPANFAIQGARLRYLDDDVLVTREALGIEDAFLARFAEYPRAPAAVWEAYERRTGDEIVARVPSPVRARLALSARLRAAAVLRRGVGDSVARLVARIEGSP